MQVQRITGQQQQQSSAGSQPAQPTNTTGKHIVRRLPTHIVMRFRVQKQVTVDVDTALLLRPCLFVFS